jgi:NTE family protein
MSARAPKKIATRPPRKSRPPVKSPIVDLALQGGGSHGAFTWGVLDALLDDGQLAFEGITGASAGAMNAVAMAEGWRRGLAAGTDPRQAAREHLADFWGSVADLPNGMAMAPASTWSNSPLGGFSAATLAGVMSQFYSPYQLNPFDFNPLRELLGKKIDFDALRAASPFKLFVCATNVNTGRARIFREHELRLEMLMASAALPSAYRAVEIDGAHYWDGGFMGNPALYPLFSSTRTLDVLLVQINPLVRTQVPDTPEEIFERINEISFNSSVLHEMRAIAFVQRLLAEGRLDPARYKGIRMHAIDAEEYLRKFGASSKLNTARSFLEQLHQIGRKAALEWLDASIAYVGHASSLRIEQKYL